MKLTLMNLRTPQTKYNYSSLDYGLKPVSEGNYEALIYMEKTSTITPINITATTYEDLIREILREVGERLEVKK